MENVNNTVAYNETSNKKNYRELPKNLRWKSWLKWQIYNQMSLSYDRAYVNGWTGGALPALEYLYKDRPDELRKALERTRDYWLCEQTFGSLVFGIYLSMEEKYANGAEFDPEMIRTVKSSLMGPVSGIGDSIMGSTIRQIVLLFFLAYALEGQVWAPWAFFGVYTFVITLPLFILFFNKGYELGREAITHLLGTPWLKAITKAAGVAAMVIMGAMTCKYTSFALTYVYEYQGVTVDINQAIENAIPGLLVLIPTFIYYWLIGKKVNYIWIVLGTLVVCVLLVLLGLV